MIFIQFLVIVGTKKGRLRKNLGTKKNGLRNNLGTKNCGLGTNLGIKKRGLGTSLGGAVLEEWCWWNCIGGPKVIFLIRVFLYQIKQ
jgi:hypothetical protein